jgi:hypothetical protein
MPGTSNTSGERIRIGDDEHELIYSMLSLEKIEEQFGSVAEMQNLITDEKGQVVLDRPVIKLLIDIIHAGLLHVYDDTPAARRVIAASMMPSQLDTMVEVFTAAFTDAFGELGEKAMAGELERTVPNRAERRSASPSPNGITSLPSSSVARKKSGKK